MELQVDVQVRGAATWWEVAAAEWRPAHLAAWAAGYLRCEWVTASHSGDFRLVSHLTGPPGVLVVATALDGDSADSVAGIFPSADFHEREVRQMFGIRFAGAADARPAFDVDFGGHPLRRDFPLTPRQAQPWPGSHEPEGKAGRRAVLPPGVNPEWSR